MIREQRPSKGNWLFQKQDGGKRIFRDLVYLGITATEWAECTNEEKLKWEKENPTLVESYEEPQEVEEPIEK